MDARGSLFFPVPYVRDSFSQVCLVPGGLKAQELETEAPRKRLRPFISPDVAVKKL